MSCDRRCFDKESKWSGHEECGTCPGQDSGPPSKMGGTYCDTCKKPHLESQWPHEPRTGEPGG